MPSSPLRFRSAETLVRGALLAGALLLPACAAAPTRAVSSGGTSAVSSGGASGSASGDAGQGADPNLATYRTIAAEMQTHFDLWRVQWYPRCVDTVHGGFGPELKHDFTPLGTNRKFVVYQSRMTWTAAATAEHYPALATEYLGYARHGVEFLDGVMWDKQYGGLFWGLEETAVPITTDKHAYGIGFGIYAAATVARITGDASALDLAMRTFSWLDQHAHDAANGGYYEALAQDGTPRLTPPAGGSPTDAIGTIYGRKSMNTHLHLLEAFSELYRVKKDPTVQARLREVFLLMRDKVTLADRYFDLYFKPDWTPIPDVDSYGHDVEGGFLLTEAAELLGIDDATTERVVHKLEDHAIQYGWDEQYGGFYDNGPPNAVADHTNKIWWVQAEGLNGMLLMHRRHAADAPYFDHFQREWSFIKTQVIDPTNQDWWGSVGRSGAPKEAWDSGMWKDTYHDGRALMTSIAALDDLAKAK